MAIARARIERNLQEIRRGIADACQRAGRQPEGVSIVAVTKSVGMEEITALIDLGLADLGESRVQQLVARAAETADYLDRRRSAAPTAVRWHMVGHLQRNKVRSVLDCVEVIHSVDSLRLAEEINARSAGRPTPVKVLMQVNCSQEQQKFGVAVGAATHLAELICTLRNLRLVGLMTMAPLVDDPQKARASFVRLRELFEEMRSERIGGEDFRHLSMGMSQDYRVAVEEGATMVRIGTALFQ